MRTLVWLLVALAACGDNRNAPPDATSTPEPDAGDDAAGTADVALTDNNGTPVVDVAFAPTLVGQYATALVRLTNHGAAATGSIEISFAGVASADYHVDATLTTCAGALAPAEMCEIAIEFRPTAGGNRVATLVIESNPGMFTVPLMGMGTMVDLHFNPPTQFSFGTQETGTNVQATVELRNDGTAPAPIAGFAISGASYTLVNNTCAGSLAPATSCDVFVRFTPQALGQNSGMLSVTSAGQTYSVPLVGRGARRITVVKNGSGTGTVASTPAGIDCGVGCSALYETDALLTATPSAQAEITSWSVAGCSNSSSCNIVADVTPITVTITFTLSGTSSLNVIVTGNTYGEARIARFKIPLGTGSDIWNCSTSCTIPLMPGDNVRVGGETYSKFGGITGACTAAPDADGAFCDFVAQAGTNTVTVTFEKYPNEQWTRLIGTSVEDVFRIEYDTGNNIVAATKSRVTKLSSVGSTLWTTIVPVAGLALGSADSIYIVSGTTVKKLDANGTEVWSRALDANSQTDCSIGVRYDDCISVANDGSVVVRSDTGIASWTTTGAVNWSKALVVSPTRLGNIIHDASGILYVQVGTGARRFQLDGTELTAFTQIATMPAARHVMTSTTLRTMDVSGGSQKDYHFGTTVLATGAYTYSTHFGAEFDGGRFSFANSTNGEAGEATFIPLDNNMGARYPILYRFNPGNLDRKTYYLVYSAFVSGVKEETGVTPIEIAYRRNGTAGQYVVGGHYSATNFAGVGWIQAFSE